MELTMERVALDALRPHPRNPRNGDTDAIARSLAVNGQYRPIVVAQDGTILAGNHTYAAAAELGWDTLAVVRLPLDPDDPRALRIMAADNKTSDLGRYDDALLADLLRSVDETVGLEGSGFAPDALDDLLASIEEASRIDLAAVTASPPPAPREGAYNGEVGTRQSKSFDQNAENYADRATRMIVLNLSPAGYAWLVGALARLGADVYGDARLTNVEVVARLAADRLDEPLPPEFAA